MANVDIANIFRVVNVLLCISYFPLLYLRIKTTREKDNIPYLIGIFFLLVGVIVGTYDRLGDSFRRALPITTIGLAVIIVSSTMNHMRDRRKLHKHQAKK